MYTNDEFASLRAMLQDAVQSSQQAAKALLTLRTEMVQREQGIREAFSQELQALRHEVSVSRGEIAAIVAGAKERIAEEARQAVAPVAAEYDREVSATSARLQRAGRAVWLWFGAAGTILLLVLLVGGVVLGHYRRELAAAKEDLQRYEDAIPVLQAYYASDAVICGGRVCVDPDPEGQRAGDKRQYRQARPRPQP